MLDNQVIDKKKKKKNYKMINPKELKVNALKFKVNYLK